MLNRDSNPSTHQLISARTSISTTPLEPPSSPPPNSPLPPLPEIRSCNNYKTTSSNRPLRPYLRTSRPSYPPTSTPGLDSRVVKCPKRVRKSRCLQSSAKSHVALSTSCNRHTTIVSPTKLPDSAQWRSNKLLNPSRLLISPTFSTADIFFALQRTFQQLPKGLSVKIPRSKLCDRLEKQRGPPTAREVYNECLLRPQSRQDDLRKRMNSLVARSIPFKSSPSLCTVQQEQRCFPQIISTNRVLFAENPPSDTFHHIPYGSCDAPTHPLKQSLNRIDSERNCESQRRVVHKNSSALHPFAFDFKGYLNSSATNLSSDDLTSLPRIPSTQTLNQLNNLNGIAPGNHVVLNDLIPKPARSYNRNSVEQADFASIPYSHTLRYAGPRSSMHHDIDPNAYCKSETMKSKACMHLPHRACFSSGAEANEQLDSEEPLTDDEINALRRKRVLWAITTVALVLIATGSILGGIIWKLDSIS